MKKSLLIIGACLSLGFVSGCTSNKASLDDPELTTKESVTNTKEDTRMESRQTTASSSVDGRTETTKDKTSLAEAIKVYQKQYPDSDITKIEMENLHDSVGYEITGVDDLREYEIFIAADGSFNKKHEESLDADEKNGRERNSKKLNLDDLLAIEEVNRIALKEAGEGIINEWTLEREWSTTYWEVLVITNQNEVMISIDAQSGEVLETEVDD